MQWCLDFLCWGSGDDDEMSLCLCAAKLGRLVSHIQATSDDNNGQIWAKYVTDSTIYYYCLLLCACCCCCSIDLLLPTLYCLLLLLYSKFNCLTTAAVMLWIQLSYYYLYYYCLLYYSCCCLYYYTTTYTTTAYSTTPAAVYTTTYTTTAWYFITWLSIALLNISICKTHSAPNRGLGVYIVDTTYVLWWGIQLPTGDTLVW